jgi:biopolymer transport protein ExbD
MIRKGLIVSQVRSGLRTRYTPRSRIGQGLIGMAPWLNLLLLLGFVAYLDAKVLLQPGVVVRLPEAPFAEGSPPGFPVVVLALAAPGGGIEEAVIFEDERYQMANERQAARLQRRLGARARSRPEEPMILLADERIGHGTVMALVTMARQAGVKSVTVSTRQPSRAPDGAEPGARP